MCVRPAKESSTGVSIILVPKKISSFLQHIRNRIVPTLESDLQDELAHSDSVLDLGCGRKSPVLCCPWVRWRVGVDLFSPFLRESNKRKIHSSYIRADVRYLPLKQKSVDAVIAIDVLEHLLKEEGFNLLGQMEEVAKKTVIVFTPNGYVPQATEDGNPWQRHKSGWVCEEFERRGFKIHGINGLRFLRGYEARIRLEPKALWRLISDFSEKIVYCNPNMAFQLFCVKVFPPT